MPDKAFQYLADRMTRALLANDFDLYRSLMVLPLTVTPRGGEAYVIADETHLRADFELYHQNLVIQGVTDIFRDVQEVQVVAPDRAVIRMTTHILQRAYRIVEPLPSRFFLSLIDGEWLIAEIESTAGHLKWALGQAKVTAQGTFEEKDDGDAKA